MKRPSALRHASNLWLPLLVIACTTAQPTQPAAPILETEDTTAGMATGPLDKIISSTNKILNTPDAYLGKVVRVRGKVDGLVGDYAFALGKESSDNQEIKLLIINSSGYALPVAPGEVTEVTGPVRRLSDIMDIPAIRNSRALTTQYSDDSLIILAESISAY